MIEDFKIYVDRLKGGKSQKIEGTYSPDLLDIQEDALRLDYPVKVRAEIYLAEEHLVFELSASTMAEIPCACCNEWVKYPLSVIDQTLTEEVDGAVFDFGPVLREALLIELPIRVECAEGKCPAKDFFKSN